MLLQKLYHHINQNKKPNRTHIPSMQDSEPYFLVQLIEPIYDLETVYIGIGKKMGDKKRNGKWIWPMSFL